MNNSRTFAAVLSGLTLLAVSALAQSGSGSASGSSSSGSATGSRSGAATTRSGTSPTSAPASAATSPSSTTAASSVTDPAGTSTTSSSMNSSVNSDTNANSNSFGPGASQFKGIDTDNDGRISRAEFSASGSTALNANADAATSDTSAAASTNSGKTEKKHWWSRRSADKSDDMDSSETFTKLDTDHDGFLSQSELASANAKLKK